MEYAKITDGVCTNSIVADADFAERLGYIPLPEGYGIGDLYNGEFWEKKTESNPEPPDEGNKRNFTGLYLGNGSYGQDFPTVFHAKENAEMLVIQDGGTGETHVVFPEANQMKDGAGEILCQVAVEGKTVKLWSDESAENQFNRAGVLYHYYSV